MTTYNTVDQHIHQICQVIAKVNRTYVPKKEDDSHTNLYYDAFSNRLLGRWINTKNGKLCLALNLSNLYFEWLNDRLEVEQMIKLEGRTLNAVEADIEQFLHFVGLNDASFRTPLHFEITNYPFIDEPIQALKNEVLQQWITYRTLANEICAVLLGHLQAEGEARIWPHHFDTGIYVTPNEKIGIGCGLAMQDDIGKVPYFYIAGYLSEKDINFEGKPNLLKGDWQTEGHWKGAYLPITAIYSLESMDRKKAVLDFYKTTMDWYLKQ